MQYERMGSVANHCCLYLGVWTTALLSMLGIVRWLSGIEVGVLTDNRGMFYQAEKM